MTRRHARRPLAEGQDRTGQRVRSVCDAVGAYIETWGFRAIHGRTWALLALSKVPVSQAEAAEFLGVSRSMMHLAISELGDLGLVRPTGPERHAPYEACLDVWPIITDVLRSREWMLMERARVALEAARNEIEFSAETGEDERFDPRRVSLLLAMTEFAQATLKMVMSVRMPHSLEHFSSWLHRAGKAVERIRIPDWVGESPRSS
jgi:DNA-binding transcriptional regulator GbsR (MarR family)